MTSDLVTSAMVIGSYVLAMGVMALAFWHLWH